MDYHHSPNSQRHYRIAEINGRFYPEYYEYYTSTAGDAFFYLSPPWKRFYVGDSVQPTAVSLPSKIKAKEFLDDRVAEAKRLEPIYHPYP